jgi:hypothetical protein
LVAGVGSVLVQLAVLVATPVALAHGFGWPFPDRVPTGPQVTAWVRQPLTPAFGVAAFACALWAAWLLYAARVVNTLAADLTYGLRRLDYHRRQRRHARQLRRLRLRRAAPGTGVSIHALASSVASAAVVVALPGTGTAHPATGPDAAPTPAPVDAVPEGSPGEPAPSSPTPLSPTPFTEPAPGRETHPPAPLDGWWVPGGWIALPTAIAIAAAWQAQRNTTPHPAPAQPPPRTVAAILRRTNRHPIRPPLPPTPNLRTDPRPERHVDPGSDPRLDPRPDLGIDLRLDLGIDVGIDLPSAGIGLIGPGAVDATRGMLITLLLARPHDIRIHTTISDWTLLVADQPPPAEVAVHPDLAAALTALDLHLLTTPAGGAGPLVLLATSPTDTADTARLAVTLRAGGRKQLTAVLIGPWPHGPTRRIDHAGRPDRTDTSADDSADDSAENEQGESGGRPLDGHSHRLGRRVTVLSAAGCAEILTILRPHPDTRSGTSDGDAGRADRPAPAPGRPAGPLAGVAPLRLYTGDPVELTTAGGDPVRLPRRAAGEVLALLAAHPDGLDRDTLLDIIWPDIRHRAAVTRLHTAIACLRATADTITSIRLIDHHHGRYRLNPAAIDIDP